MRIDYRRDHSFLCAGLVSVALVITGWAAHALADSSGTKPAAKKSLDEELLDDLESEPAVTSKNSPASDNKAADKSRTPPADSIKQPGDAAGDDLDDALLKGLDDGEGTSLGGKSSGENSLARLNERMREVQRRIARTQSGEQTQRLEREIADELAKLIDQLQRQARKSGQSSSSSSTSSRPRGKQPGQSGPAAEQPSDKPARESSDRLRQDKTAKVDAEYQELLKDVWGHLPPHLRQQMEQSANEEFLPKYELEISEYFRALNQRGKKR